MNLNLNANAHSDWRGSDSHLCIGSAPARRMYTDATALDNRREYGKGNILKRKNLKIEGSINLSSTKQKFPFHHTKEKTHIGNDDRCQEAKISMSMGRCKGWCGWTLISSPVGLTMSFASQLR